MKRFLILVPLFLAACGGGGDFTADGPVTVNVHVEPGAITCTECYITVGSEGAASAPLPAASAPAASAPVVVPPLGAVQTIPNSAIPPGQFAWTAGGMSYALVFRDGGFAQFVYLSSSSGSEWIAEVMIDNGFDTHPPDNTDAAIRAYLADRVLPALNAWLTANAGRFATYTPAPVNMAPVPTTWTAFERAAALAPQMLTISGTPPQAGLR